MIPTKARVAVIGLGPHGRRLVAALSTRDDVVFSALVDRAPDARVHPDLPADAPRFDDLDAALATRPDLVCIATNGPSHAPLALAALKAGATRLMVSKPLACSVGECRQILDAASAAKARVAVDHIRRVHPTYQFLQSKIASGVWGTARLVSMQRPGIGLGCNGTHSYDAIRFLLGRDVDRVIGFVDPPRGPNPRGKDFIDPGGLSILQFQDDVRGVVAQVEDGAGPTSLEIDCTLARIRYDERTGALEILEKDPTVKPGPGRPPVFRDGEVPLGAAAAVDMIPPLARMFGELLGTGPMACDGIHGLKSIQILAATHASSREGHRPIEVASAPLDALWLPIT